jgi:hypothetical protein
MAHAFYTISMMDYARRQLVAPRHDPSLGDRYGFSYVFLQSTIYRDRTL